MSKRRTSSPLRHPRALAALCGTVVLAAGACRWSGIQPPGPVPGAVAERDVIAAAQRLFDGMRARDTAMLRELIDPDVVIVSSREAADGLPTVRRQGVADFLRAVGGSAPGELRERMWSPEVRVDGAVATLWAPYDFHRGERFSHCGHDAFHFARVGGRWVVTALTYTVRLAPCAGPGA